MQPRSSWKELFTVVGSIAGIAALCWNVYWTVSSANARYVQLGLEVRVPNVTTATALTTIENVGELPKSIDYAALVISPTQMDLRTVVEELRRCSKESTPVNISAEPLSRVLGFLPALEEPTYCAGEISLIPLPFFYKEQQRIGNEKLTARTLIDLTPFRAVREASRVYEVRFIVRGQGRTRSTQDLLIR